MQISKIMSKSMTTNMTMPTTTTPILSKGYVVSDLIDPNKPVVVCFAKRYNSKDGEQVLRVMDGDTSSPTPINTPKSTVNYLA